MPDPPQHARALVDQRYSGRPDPGRIWRRRGQRAGGPDLSDRMHAAWDIPGPDGTPVHAVLPGRVIFSGQRGGYGNTVILLHTDPPQTDAAGSGALTTAYCHLQERLVEWGEEVAADQVIALMGRTFRNAAGGSGGVRWINTHLHFSVQLVHGDSSRERFRDDQGTFEGSRPRADPTEGQLAGRRQGWFRSAYEEDWTRQVKPDDWLGELGVADAAEDLGGRPRRRYRPRRRQPQQETLGVQVQDTAGAPVADEPFEVHFADGTHARGRTDREGRADLSELPAGDAKLRLPRRKQGGVTVTTSHPDEEEGAEAGSGDSGDEGSGVEGEGHPVTTGGEATATCEPEATIRRVWVWLQGSPTGPQLRDGATRDADGDGTPDAVEYVRDRIAALNVTDAVVSINDHGWAGSARAYRPAVRAGTFPEPRFRVKPMYRPIDNLVTLLQLLKREANVDVHLMAFVGPWSTHLRDCARVMAEVGDRVSLRSVQLDCEWWWTLHPPRQRAIGGNAVKQHFFDEWPGSARPELGIGVTGVGSAGRVLRSVLRWCDFGIPQLYASQRNYGADLTSARTLELAGRHYQAYLDSLRAEASLSGLPKRVVPGQTAFQRYIGHDGRRMRDMCDVLLQLGDPCDTDGTNPSVEEVAFWSDKWLQPRYNAAGRLFVRRISAQARGDGLTRGDLPTILAQPAGAASDP